jgi:indole-3-acetate monooxygenase
VVDGASVPSYLAPSPFAPMHIDRPLYRIPAFTLASTGGAAAVLGMAQGCIDALVDLAAGKATDNGQTLAHRAHAQSGVASADARLRSARLLLHTTADEVTAAAVAGRPIDESLRGQLRAAMSHAGRTGREVAASMYELGSSASLYTSGRLDRVVGDTNAAAQHALLQSSVFETAGRLMFGLPSGAAVL